MACGSVLSVVEVDDGGGRSGSASARWGGVGGGAQAGTARFLAHIGTGFSSRKIIVVSTSVSSPPFSIIDSNYRVINLFSSW